MVAKPLEKNRDTDPTELFKSRLCLPATWSAVFFGCHPHRECGAFPMLERKKNDDPGSEHGKTRKDRRFF